MERSTCRYREEDGFTLVELLIATSLLLVTMFAALGLIEISQRAEPEIASQNSKIQSAEIGMERISRELRQATDVITASPSVLVVETYLSRTSCAGTTLGSARLCRVTYSCSAGACTRTPAEVGGSSGGATVTVVEGLASNNVFTYGYTYGSVNEIGIDLVVASDDGPGEDAITLNGGVVLRNVSQAPEPT